ncbi:interleukin-18 receptor 1 isoform X2 [Larimichthys crocea]|uniref:interleukin-18 receptor 1 isoform X2 n=1 Tax=Larimichthys crocea TaxID=215358 RepID=UPI000F5ED47B|nr:interleukin-18 receptor 1 isoform X2 [Larimichthys crocea]
MMWCVMMTARFLLALLPLLLTLLTGVCARTAKEIYVKTGDLVALKCPCKGSNCVDAKPIWTSYTTKEMVLTKMSSAERMQMSMLIHGRSLVILNSSVKHQGNYSCSLGNASRQYWFSLMVYTTVQEETTYPWTCAAQEACELICPDANVPAKGTPNITSKDIIWHKEGESSLKTTGYFSRVKENDHGVYTCTRPYLYHDQTYNMTFTVVLDVESNIKSNIFSRITSPRMSEVFYVDLGSPKVIDCKAVMYSKDEEVFWLSGDSFVDTNASASVYYNYTSEYDTEGIKMTASLVLKKVSEEDLSKNYICKLQTDKEAFQQYVNITLTQKFKPSYKRLALGIVCVVIVMVVTVVIYVKFKIDITLFLRDTLGLHSSISDGKSYDAFLMSYKSDTDSGLNEDDRKQLESVLEETFGYSLCLFDRDILPGESVAEAVLDCIEQSRTLVLVPTSSDRGPESGLLSAIHEALVERQTRLVFIKTEATDVSLPEALQLLGKAGDCVTWKGESSRPLSSSFWKQLRYHLPAPQCTPKITLLPQTV